MPLLPSRDLNVLILKKLEFKKKEEIPALPLPKPQAFVTVVSPEGAKPALTADGEFYACVLSDGNFDGVIFKINKNESNKVFGTLKQKYGSNVKVTPMKWQNSPAQLMINVSIG